jgi:hypothetical protein
MLSANSSGRIGIGQYIRILRSIPVNSCFNVDRGEGSDKRVFVREEPSDMSSPFTNFGLPKILVRGFFDWPRQSSIIGKVSSARRLAFLVNAITGYCASKITLPS